MLMGSSFWTRALLLCSVLLRRLRGNRCWVVKDAWTERFAVDLQWLLVVRPSSGIASRAKKDSALASAPQH